jgi:hypothetical protein
MMLAVASLGREDLLFCDVSEPTGNGLAHQWYATECDVVPGGTAGDPWIASKASEGWRGSTGNPGIVLLEGAAYRRTSYAAWQAWRNSMSCETTQGAISQTFIRTLWEMLRAAAQPSGSRGRPMLSPPHTQTAPARAGQLAQPHPQEALTAAGAGDRLPERGLTL